MKIDRRWVAGIAALLVAAFLVAMPCEGTALPLRYPAGAPWEPAFGDPEEPYGAAQITRDPTLRCLLRLRAWFLHSTNVAVRPVSSRRGAASRGSSGATKHE